MSKPPNALELERELEWRLCVADPWHFIFKYVKVNVVGKGYLPMEEWPHLEGIVNWMATKHGDVPTRSGALKARQISWTTTSNAFALWSAFFHPNKEWLQVSVGEDAAQKALFQKFKSPYLSLPVWMRKRGPGVVTDTMTELLFENGSGMVSIPSTGRSGRSVAMYGCIFDEAAFMVDADEVFAGIEPMIYGPIFVFSTANGMGNFFHETWTESLADDSLWDMSFYSWDVRPDRNQAWYDNKKLMYRGKEYLFFQEYPSNPGEAFMKSGRTAFDLELLEESHDWRLPLYRIDVALLQFHRMHRDRWELSKVPAGETRDLELHVFEEPHIERDDDGTLLRKPNYGIGVDVAEGLIHGDFSAISVRDINRGEQVATLRAHIPIYDLGPVVEMVGYEYHTALVGVERNNFGLVPLQYLQDNHYPRLYRMDSIAQIRRGDRTAQYGWLTSRTTKPKMVQDMAFALSGVEPLVQLHDRRWLQEATTFISTGTGRYEATPPNTDDLMIAELVAHQMELDVGRFPIVWQDKEPGPMTFGDFFEIMSYARTRKEGTVELDRPIGQTSQPGSGAKKSFTMKIRGN